MATYEPVIGMEVHAELKSRRKMFCGCLNDPEEMRPNVNVCPVCLAHPGTLPVANRQPIEQMIRIGLALGGKIPETARFYRKNYFYPDLPKGYQITSQLAPLVMGGELLVDGREVVINHIHLEEDTGTLGHAEDSSLVDFNRAGVPLMELVTEPVMTSGQEARRFCEELQLMLRYLKASAANMEKGEMRCEVNISLRPAGRKELGTKVEIKNLNSFKAVERAVDYEIKRQTEILEGGGEVIQETRGWDEVKQQTVAQRRKEEAHDYRYFPEPDLPVFRLADFGIEKLKAQLPELPAERRERFQKEYDLSAGQVETLVREEALADFFERAVSELKADREVASFANLYNYLVSDLKGLMAAEAVSFAELKVTPENFVDLINLLESGEIGSRVAKDVLAKMFKTGADAAAIIKEEGLSQMSDWAELGQVARKVIKENEKVVQDYREGKEAAMKFLVGQAMKETRGRGNPELLKKALEENIK